MKKLPYYYLCVFLLLSLVFVETGCKKKDSGSTQPTTIVQPPPGPPGDTSQHNTAVTWDVDVQGIPKFMDISYIALNKIYRISRFRSSMGHSYSDSYEDCRSMKHYFQPWDTADWSAISIASPVKGTVTNVVPDWIGTQLWIVSDQYPCFTFILFHVNLVPMLSIGDTLVAGGQIGTHIGSQTFSDIAVGVNTPGGWKLISYFDVMTDALFNECISRGVLSRDDLIISKDERNANPLSCSGEAFTGIDALTDWVPLN